MCTEKFREPVLRWWNKIIQSPRGARLLVSKDYCVYIYATSHGRTHAGIIERHLGTVGEDWANSISRSQAANCETHRQVLADSSARFTDIHGRSFNVLDDIFKAKGVTIVDDIGLEQFDFEHNLAYAEKVLQCFVRRKFGGRYGRFCHENTGGGKSYNRENARPAPPGDPWELRAVIFHHRVHLAYPLVRLNPASKMHPLRRGGRGEGSLRISDDFVHSDDLLDAYKMFQDAEEKGHDSLELEKKVGKFRKTMDDKVLEQLSEDVIDKEPKDDDGKIKAGAWLRAEIRKGPACFCFPLIQLICRLSRTPEEGLERLGWGGVPGVYVEDAALWDHYIAASAGKEEVGSSDDDDDDDSEDDDNEDDDSDLEESINEGMSQSDVAIEIGGRNKRKAVDDDGTIEIE